MKFLYTIRTMCGDIWFTCKPEVAEKASKNGCIVTCKGHGGEIVRIKH